MRRFGLIGRPLGHSASAAYFTDKFMSEGITDCEYSLYELPTIEALPALLERLPELCGLNVTIPYKREVMAFLDEVSPEAQAIGAVNCIDPRHGRRFTGRAICPCRTRHSLCAGFTRCLERQLHL